MLEQVAFSGRADVSLELFHLPHLAGETPFRA